MLLCSSDKELNMDKALLKDDDKKLATISKKKTYLKYQ